MEALAGDGRTNQSDGVGPKQVALFRPAIYIGRFPIQTPHELQTLVLRLSFRKRVNVGASLFRVAFSATLFCRQHPEV